MSVPLPVSHTPPALKNFWDSFDWLKLRSFRYHGKMSTSTVKRISNMKFYRVIHDRDSSPFVLSLSQMNYSFSDSMNGRNVSIVFFSSMLTFCLCNHIFVIEFA